MILTIHRAGSYWSGCLRTPGGQMVDAFDDTIEGLLVKVTERLKHYGVKGSFELRFNA